MSDTMIADAVQTLMLAGFAVTLHPVELRPAKPAVGCICPPTAELTCQGPLCPRRGDGLHQGGEVA